MPRTAADLIAEERAKHLKGAPDGDLIDALQKRGFFVLKDEKRAERQVKIDAPRTGKVRFAISSDTHLASNYQQLTYWQDFTEKASKWGAEFMLHAGDVVEGGRMHKDQEYLVFRHGAEAQGLYAAKAVPKLIGRDSKTVLPTKIIGGNHDESFWKDAGANVLRVITSERPDLEFLGAPIANVHIGPVVVRLMHPKGGVAYARSYKLQKFIEQMAPDDKPHLLCVGHYHVTCHLPDYRNVHGFLLPCFQAQTPFLKTLGLSPVIGGLLLEIEYSKRGLEELTTKWITYKTPLKNDTPLG